MRYTASIAATRNEGAADQEFQTGVVIINGAQNKEDAERAADERCQANFPSNKGWVKHRFVVLQIPDEQPTVGKKVSKPVPRELVVCPVFGCLSPALRIVTSSDDAKVWIDTEAKQFGVLVSLTTISPGSYTLYVSEAYDANDVLAYLNSYNDPAPDLA